MNGKENILIKYVFGLKEVNGEILIKYMFGSQPNYFSIPLILKQSHDFKIIHFIKN